MNRAFAAIVVGLSLYLTGAAAAAAETEERAEDCSSVARFYALMLQGEKLIDQGSEEEGESLFIRAKQVRMSERQRSIQRHIRSSITDESYLKIYRTCWDGYWNLTATSNRHDARPGGGAPTLNPQACQCPVEEEDLCESESENFDS